MNKRVERERLDASLAIHAGTAGAEVALSFMRADILALSCMSRHKNLPVGFDRSVNMQRFSHQLAGAPIRSSRSIAIVHTVERKRPCCWGEILWDLR